MKAPTDASPDRHAAVTMAGSMVSDQDTAVQRAQPTTCDMSILEEPLYQKAFDVFGYSPHSKILKS